MDFAMLSNLVQANGYKKVNTKSQLIKFDTLFSRGEDKINVHWQLGGYVREITVSNSDGVVAKYKCVEEFAEATL